ncbi:MAG TPA: hypothetical protein VF193_00735 [Steroidobacter sp.]
MKTTLRVVNILLLALLGFYAFTMLKEGVPQVIGASLWLLPSLITLRTIQQPSNRQVRATYVANAIAILAVLIIAYFEPGPKISIAMGILTLTAPFALNIWGIRRLAHAYRAAQVRAAEDEIALLPESETFAPSQPTDGDERTACHETATSTRPTTQPATSSASGNYFARHWRGELSLPVSYWINGSLFNTVLAGFLVLVGESLGRLFGESLSVRVAAWLALAIIAFVVSATAWSAVGIWRSAARHPSRGGSKVWAGVAQAMVVVGLLTCIKPLNETIVPMVKEYAPLAFGYDPLGRIEATVTSNGAAIVLTGSLGLGSAKEVRHLLDHAPGVRTLVLDSDGGRLREAELIAELTRERGLDTYVETHCESACTFIFLAGRDRAATPNARLGFHRPSFPGVDDSEMADVTHEMLAIYRKAGVSEDFLARVERTPSSDMWYPSWEELIDANVIKRISLGGEQALGSTLYRSKSELEHAFRSDELMQALDERFPGTVEAAIDAAWKAHEQGGQDEEVFNVVRQLIAANYPKLIASVDDEALVSFVELTVDQLLAARMVSDEACERLVLAQLDVRHVLPPELVERERTWLLQALRSPEPEVPEEMSREEMDRIVMPFMTQLDPQTLAVLAQPRKHQGQSALVCEAHLSFMSSLQTLPPRSRALIFRTLQRYEEE